jgi:hypothetical protein
MKRVSESISRDKSSLLRPSRLSEAAFRKDLQNYSAFCTEAVKKFILNISQTTRETTRSGPTEVTDGPFHGASFIIN